MIGSFSRRRFCALAVAALFLACDPNVFDTSFGGSGTVSLGDPGFAPTVLGLSDGGVVSTGRADRLLTRIDYEGKIDPTWGALVPADITGGITLTKTSGGLLVAGVDNQSRPRLVHMRDDGKVDTSFANGAVLVPGPVGGFGVAPVGAGVYLGFVGVTSLQTIDVPQIDVLSIWTDGSVKATTRVDLPILDPPAPGLTVSVNGVVPTSLGVVVAVNVHYVNVVPLFHSFRWSYLLRFRSDGTVDPTFGHQGLSQPTYAIPSSISISAVAQQIIGLPDGRIAAIGQLDYLTDWDGSSRKNYFLQLLRADGSNDASFGSNGVVYLSKPGEELLPSALASNAAGTKLFVAGMRLTAGAPALGVVAGYETATGALTSNFGAGGYATVPRVPSSLSLRLGGIGRPQLYVGAHLVAGGPTVSRILIP